MPKQDSAENAWKNKLPPVVRTMLLTAALIFVCIWSIHFLLKPEQPQEPVHPPQQHTGGKYADILKKLSAPDKESRISAVEQLAELNNLDATKLLVDFAGTKNTDSGMIRILIGALSSVTDKASLDWLGSDALYFPDPAVRRFVTAASPFLKTVPPVTALARQFSDKDEWVRFNTLKALSVIGTLESIAAMEHGLMDSSWSVREETIRTLGSLKNPAGHKLLVKNCGLFPVTEYEFWLLQEELTKNATAETIRYMEEECLFGADPDARLLSANVIGSVKYEGNADRLLKRFFSFKPETGAGKDVESLLWAAGRIISEKGLTENSGAVDYFMSYTGVQNERISLAAAHAMALLPQKLRDTIPTSPMPADWRIKAILTAADDKQPRKAPDGMPDVLSGRFQPNPEKNVIDRGLFWLLRHQEHDGRWSCAKHNPYHEHVPLPAFTYEDEVVDPSVTGLAILCFLHSGYTHQYGPYMEPVRKALEYIISCQADDGQINLEKNHRHTRKCLSMGEDHGTVPVRYNHNIGTQALVEAYAMTNDAWLRPYAQKALDHAHNRIEEDFKWSYYLEPTDIGPSSSYITALEIAKHTDLTVSPEDYAGAKTYLQKLTDPETGRIIHICPIPWCFGGYDSTASGIFLRFLTGYDRTDLQKKSIEWLMPHKPIWNVHYIIPKVAEDLTLVKEDILNFWQWYYCTLSYWNGGRELKPEWNWADDVILQLKEHQRAGGDLDGSWDPEGAWCGVGGRVYSTAFSILTLEARNAYAK